MLFNSAAFIFGFAPLALLGFFVLARWHGRAAALSWLLAASLFFYGWWKPQWLPLLLASMACNLTAGRIIARAGDRAGRWLAGAVAANLLLLFGFKYLAFFGQALAGAAGLAWTMQAPELPLGISFFTFTQIAYLVDVHRGRVADFDPLRYGLFVTYYPHLVAGPILHHAEMMPQFAREDIFRFSAARLADGCVYFLLGLFKKTVLADQFARYATPAFDAASTEPLSFFASWGAALAYTLQLYFDFSGYSDMAIGLALMIGVRLPLNFHSPYKAANIADFWRRWHMTLSRFLRDYLYIPLGGNRLGAGRRSFNLFVTMLLGGLWHGAGWTFLLWGTLHGVYLLLHGGWRDAVRRLGLRPSGAAAVLARQLSWALTFFAVVVAWVFFRAADLPSALAMLRGMAGLNGSLLPDQIIAAAPALGTLAHGVGKVPYLGDGTVMGFVELCMMLSIGVAIVRFAPALHELTDRTRYLLVVPCGALALQQVLYGRSSEFLYFQF